MVKRMYYINTYIYVYMNNSEEEDENELPILSVLFLSRLYHRIETSSLTDHEVSTLLEQLINHIETQLKHGGDNVE